jgi:DNA-directed RNA polymerase specialized sigma24 family protein
VLDGYYVDELSVEAIADRHGRSVEAIYKLLQRIRQALLDCMERKAGKAGT